MSGAAIGGAYTEFAVLQIEDASYGDTVSDPSNARSVLTLDTDGLLSASGSEGGSQTYLTGAPASSYEVKFHKNSGTTPTGSTLDVWLPLSTARSLTLSQGVEGSSTCNLTVSIGLLGTSTALDSATIVLTAIVETGA
jgi:hypothetical protein